MSLASGRFRPQILASASVLAVLGALLPAMAARAATAPPAPVVTGATVSSPVAMDVSAPLTKLPEKHEDAREKKEKHPAKPVPRPGAGTSGTPSATTAAAAPATSANFEGVGQGFSGPSGTFSVSSAPPDTNIAVGPNHVVEMVNSSFAIFNKSGSPLYGPVAINTLWSGFGGGCQTNNDGDPTVEYDPIADRFVLSQFSVNTTPYMQCVAVSQTADPTGSYYRYAFSYGNTEFPDYPKMSVWPDGYYITFNIFNNGSTFAGAKMCAYDRAKMLTGGAATQQCFPNTSTSYGGILPSDVNGGRLPPSGAPNYMVALGATSSTLAYWKFHADWANPTTASTLTGPIALTTAAYSEACNGGTCIPQAGTTRQLDSLGDRLMYRLAYRNFGDHEALVVNHSVTSGSSVGVRWYELRPDASQSLSIFQQGTYAPDSNYRWMGSAGIDASGDIGLGFSLSGSSLKPSIHYTGRLPGDPAGTMGQGEGTLIDGSGVQTGIQGLTRWGDYSAMSVDPSDGCTFWYANEYLASNGEFNWHTRIGSFKFPSCGSNDFSISASPNSLTLNQGQSGTSTVSTAVTSGSAETVNLSVTGVPSGATASLNPTSVTAGGSSTLSVSAGTASPGTYTLTVTGTAPSASHTAAVTLSIPANDFSLALNPTSGTVPAGSAGTLTSTATVTRTSGNDQNVSFSSSGAPSGVSVSFAPASVATTASGASSTMTLNVDSSTAAGSYAITVTGTGDGGASHSATYTLTVQAPSDFSMAASPSSLSVAQGASGTSTISTTTTSGSGQSVSMSASGQPSGTTVSFNPTSVSSGSSSTMTVAVGTSTATGTYTITVTGTGATATHTTTVALTVTASDFSISASPSNLSVAQGGSGTSTIATAVSSGAAQNVSLSASGQPTGTTVSFNPTSVSSGSSSTMTVAAGASTAAGSYTITVTGTGDTATHTTTVTLTVTASDFSISASPSSLSVPQGGSGTSTIATAVTGGAAQTVSLTASGAPAGVTATLNPTSVSAGASSTLTLSVSSSAAAGSYTVTVTGSGATGATHSTTVALTVTTGGIVNGDFETGNLSGWTSAGTTSVSTTAHAGKYSGMVGSTSPTNGDSSLAQTFTAPTGMTQLGLWYRVVCPDSVKYDWATVTLKDNTANTTSTLLGKTCTNSGSWAQQTASLTAGHSYTLTLLSHDDNYAGDATYTLYDDVTLSAPPPPPPAGITNGGFETGNLSGWTSAGATAAVSGGHSGSYSARVGSTSAFNGDSSIAQSFTAPTGATKLSFWYQVHCPDTVTYDWATATLKDNTSNTTTTVLAKTCTNSGSWVQATASITAGHSYTLTLIDHDDNYPSDPTYTLYDDVATQ